MKNIVIAGRIGKDGVLRRTQSGDPILGFSVAVDDGFGDNKRTIWFDVSVFGKRGQTLEPMMTKGTAVCVSGELSTREHEGKTYLTVNSSNITIQGGGERREKAQEKPAKSFRDELDDDLAF